MGDILVDSAPGTGATFTVRFPRPAAPAGGEPEAPHPPPAEDPRALGRGQTG